MNIEKYKKYVNEMCNNIKNKLGKESEEFDFFVTLANTYNEVCNERRKLENALDEIEKYIENHKRENGKYIYGLAIPKFVFDSDIEDIEKIIKKAKGE